MYLPVSPRASSFGVTPPSFLSLMKHGGPSWCGLCFPDSLIDLVDGMQNSDRKLGDRGRQEAMHFPFLAPL